MRSRIFYSTIEINGKIENVIFDRHRKKFWKSRWVGKYPEYWGLPYRPSVNFLWPWWWFYSEDKTKAL